MKVKSLLYTFEFSSLLVQQISSTGISPFKCNSEVLLSQHQLNDCISHVSIWWLGSVRILEFWHGFEGETNTLSLLQKHSLFAVASEREVARVINTTTTLLSVLVQSLCVSVIACDNDYGSPCGLSEHVCDFLDAFLGFATYSGWA